MEKPINLGTLCTPHHCILGAGNLFIEFLRPTCGKKLCPTMSYSQILPLPSSDDEIGALRADEIQIRIFCFELMRSQDETGGQGEYVLHVGRIFACGM